MAPQEEEIFSGGGRTKSYFMAELPTMAKIKAKEIWDMYNGLVSGPESKHVVRIICYYHIGGIEMEYGLLLVHGHISKTLLEYNQIFWQDVKKEIEVIFIQS